VHSEESGDATATYDEIATRFLFPSADAARMAVPRALRRLADWISRKKRD
jgi:hypothetical protein